MQPEVVRFSSIPESQVVYEGSSTLLDCAIHAQNTTAGLPHPRLHWIFNGSDLTEVCCVLSNFFLVTLEEEHNYCGSHWYNCLATSNDS